MAELARCVKEHNELSSSARKIWAQAQESGQRVGALVGKALSAGISWRELSGLLAAMDTASPPAGLVRASQSEVAESTASNPARGVAQQYCAPDDQEVPVLLARAYAVVAATPEQEMASRDLAVALAHHPNTIGPDLCALLREVGVTRPNRGKIKARYGGWTGSPLPGFTAACLERAIDAYRARAAMAAGAKGPGRLASSATNVPPQATQLTV
ncbi:hypothetical protein GCM10010300_77470 [Streptomyces olivaceoviridis]|nr:hypothetical protein GCM10010300_77470 [Streptomyces olivaceoviridis]